MFSQSGRQEFAHRRAADGGVAVTSAERLAFLQN